MEMKKKILFMTCLVAIFLLPNLSSAECTNIGYFNSFALEGSNTVILYAGSKPVLRFDVLNCTVEPSSKIQVLKSDVCDGDEIMVDGFKCTMMEIKPVGP
jgi:hypothetical protein